MPFPPGKSCGRMEVIQETHLPPIDPVGLDLGCGLVVFGAFKSQVRFFTIGAKFLRFC
jgi:hypothetical protein